MVADIKFIHTADLHLGAPVNSGETPPEGLQELFAEAGYTAFKRIVKLAREQKVDFMVISGDLYDREARSVKASRIFVNQCRLLKEQGIEVYIINGNHDPRGQAEEPFSLPDNVYVFPETEVTTREYTRERNLKARILGQSYRQKYEDRSMFDFYTVPDRSILNLGLLHTQLDPQNKRYVPVSRSNLLSKKGIDYWALGHIHIPRIIKKEGPSIIFPGTPQARIINQEGLRGCFLVETETGRNFELNFIPVAPVIFKNMELYIDRPEKGELKNLTDLKNRLEKKARKLADKTRAQKELGLPPDLSRNIINQSIFSSPVQGYILRWFIRGSGPLHQFVSENRSEVKEEMVAFLNDLFAEHSPFLWTHSLFFRTGPELPEEEQLRKNNEVFAEIEKIIQDIRNDQELKKELIEHWGKIWQGSPEDKKGPNNLFHPDDRTIKELLQEARQQIIEELYTGGR